MEKEYLEKEHSENNRKQVPMMVLREMVIMPNQRSF